jgi:hypothetical protein
MASPDPSYAIQMAVSAALMASSDMIAAFGGTPRVWDRVPADSASGQAVFPYCTIGEDQVVPHINQNTDCSEVFAKVEVWSRAANKGEVKLIAGAVRAALDRDIGLAGGHVIVTHAAHQLVFRREPDGLTESAIVTIRYQTQALSLTAA